MADREKGGSGLGRSWQELAVSFIGYVVGFLVILFVFDATGLIQRQPQQAFALALVVPLVPFLILLAYSGRIDAIKAPGGIEITFDDSDHTSEHTGTQPAPGRRTILKTGGLLAAIGAIWSLVSRWADIKDLVTDSDGATGGGGDETLTDTQPTTETETPGEETTSPDFTMGGELIASIERDVEDFDPAQHGHVVSSKVLNPVYEGLGATDFQGRPQPYLAESVDMKRDTSVTINSVKVSPFTTMAPSTTRG